jgi:hypothetical protein
MFRLKDLLNEALPTREIDPSQFPNPVTGAMKKIFLNKGEQDGNPSDDIVKTQDVSIPAAKLKASQDAIYLGKSLGMAVGGVKGGDLDAVISDDNHILDGHHRWAATMFASPTTTVGGVKAELKIGDLIPVLRSLGDVFGNDRRGEPTGGDKNIFQSDRADIEATIANLDTQDTQFINPGDATKFVEDVGGMDVLEKRLKLIQKAKPPSGAPPRTDMPVIEPKKGEMPKMKNLLQKGKIDVRAPYA